METADKQENQALGFMIKQINNMIRRRLDQRFAEAGLSDFSGMQGPILGYIQQESQQRDVFQRDIEKTFQIRRSTATVMLQNLEQKGYIEREAVKSDARLKRISLTERAVRYDREIHRLLDRFNLEVEAGISPAEKEAFCKVLAKIVHNLEEE